MFGRKQPLWRPYNTSVPQPLTTYAPVDAPRSQLGDLATLQRLPDEAKALLREIEAACVEGLEYGGRAQVVDEQAMRHLVTIRDTETPNVVAAWLELPPGSTVETPQGTLAADAVLHDQLATLLRAAQRAKDATLGGARLGMNVESVYLREKYGTGQG